MAAGGNLATVTTLESFRRFPNRIKSSFIQDPMLNPNASSMSYYMNSYSSGVLRWFWRIYLKLDHMEHKTKEDNRYVSNEGAVKMSKLPLNKSLWRLIYPQSDLPHGLESNDLMFIITTSTADPLHDDGVDLFQKLTKVGANVTHVDARGSHCMSLKFRK